MDLGLNAAHIFSKTEYETRLDVINQVKPIKEMVGRAKEKQEENQFSRIEQTSEVFSCDPMFFGYNGISHNSSNNKIITLSYYKHIGYTQDWVRIKYRRGNTVFADSFSNIQYVIDEKDNPYTNYLVVDEKDNLVIRENENVFPLAYVVKPSIKDISIVETKDVFANQNLIYHAIADDEEDVLTKLVIEEQNVENLEKNVLEESDLYVKQNFKQEASFSYQITAKKQGPVYLYLTRTIGFGVKILVNGEEIKDQAYLEYDSGIFKLGDFNPEDKIEVKLVLDDVLFAYQEIFFYQEDIDKTKTLKENLNPVDIQQFSNLKIAGTIQLEEPSTIYLGVPYSDGWVAKVDGKKVEIIPVLLDQMAIDVEEGEHVIELTYQAKGLVEGMIITVISIVCLYFWNYYSKRKMRQLEETTK